MAERIGVIERGRLIAEGTLDALRKQLGHDGTTLEEVFLDLVARQSAAA
jgi:ABC-2 type transport system ATP-binding protein